MSDYLVHYGVLGQKWGVRRYQNSDGTLTEMGKKHYGKTGRFPVSERKLTREMNIHDASEIITDAFSELKSRNFKKWVPVEDQRQIANQIARKLNLDENSARFLVLEWFEAIRRNEQ